MGRRSVSAGSAVVAPAVASAGWTVAAGGPATGTAGQVLLTVRPAVGGPDQVWACESSQIGQVADVTDVAFDRCLQ